VKPVEVLDAGIDIYCPNPACPAQVEARVRWFCGRSQMDIEGLGDKLVDQLVDGGKVHTFADLYRLKVEDLSELERMGEKSAQNVIDGVAASRKQGLDRLLAGLGVHHVGNRVAYVLASNFGNLDALANASREELSAVHEIGAVIAESVYDFFHNPAGQKAIEELKSVGVDPKMEVVKRSASGAATPTKDQPLAGQTIVVTGGSDEMDREDLQELIRSLGGKPSGSVSKKTHLVVYGEGPGSKLTKAQELGINTQPIADFLHEFREHRATVRRAPA
jgi:DNA ligase (NAD+)